MLNHLRPILSMPDWITSSCWEYIFWSRSGYCSALFRPSFFSLGNIIMYFTYFIAQSTVLPASQLVIILSSFCCQTGWDMGLSQFYSHRRQQYEAQTRALELRKDLIQNALFDQLTGVANRRHFFQAAKKSLAVLFATTDHSLY